MTSNISTFATHNRRLNMRINLLSIILVLLPTISEATPDSSELCKAIVGDYSLSCTGDIPKIDELNRMKVTVISCLEISFILEGKDTITGRVFFPASKSLTGASITENTNFNDNSLRLVVQRSAKWNDEYNELEMDTTTDAFDSSGKNISSKKIVMSIINNKNDKILKIKNNDAASDTNSVFKNATCTLVNRN